jgi:hypothetical protein
MDQHPNADSYVVVEPNLSDVDGWDHYHDREFVTAVEQGSIHREPPIIRDTMNDDPIPIADGGYPTSAGIMPVDAAHLDSWLKEQTEAAGFEIHYTESSCERTTLCRTISMIRKTMSRAVEPTVRCLPAAPGEDSFGVGLTDIEEVHVVSPPMDVYLPETDDPVERAGALADLAADNPYAVDISQVLVLLDQTDDAPQANALEALRELASTRPKACTPALPILRSILEGDCRTPKPALAVLECLAEVDAADVAPMADVIASYLTEAEADVRRQAAICITTLTEADPADTVETVPALTKLLEDRTASHHAAHSLSLLAEADPEAVTPAPVLADALTDDTLTDGARLGATAALGRVANRDPTVAVGLVDDVAALLEVENPKLRNNAAGLLWEVSRLHADHVEPYVERVAELLSVDDDLTRVNASAILARVAEDRPGVAREYIEHLRRLLTDSHHLARENACWALGHLEDSASREALQAASFEDDHESVRKRAQWAVARIDGPSA